MLKVAKPSPAASLVQIQQLPTSWLHMSRKCMLAKDALVVISRQMNLAATPRCFFEAWLISGCLGPIGELVNRYSDLGVVFGTGLRMRRKPIFCIGGSILNKLNPNVSSLVWFAKADVAQHQCNNWCRFSASDTALTRYKPIPVYSESGELARLVARSTQT